MNCPKCVMKKLETIAMDGVTIDACPNCGGVWYDADELRHCVSDPCVIDKAVSEGLSKPRPSDSKCPRCSSAMVNGGLSNEFLRVDKCPKCHGIWLDKPELALLKKTLGI